MKRSMVIIWLTLALFGDSFGVPLDKARLQDSSSARADIAEGRALYGEDWIKSILKRKVATNESENREPSLQAYGLPKRILEDNGNIERVSVDRITGFDGRVKKVNIDAPVAGVRAYGAPKKHLPNNGVIERWSNADDFSENSDSSAKISRSAPYFSSDLDDQESADGPAGIRAYGLPKRFLESTGTIERVVIDSDQNHASNGEGLLRSSRTK